MGLTFRQRCACLQDVGWDPIGEGSRLPAMSAAICMDITNGGETCCVESIGKADQGRPDAAVNEGDLAVQEAAGQHVWGGPQKARDSKNAVGGWVRPPAPLDGLAGDELGDTGNGAMGRFE